MLFTENQTVNLRVVDPNADEGVWAIIVTVAVMVKSGDKMPKQK